MKILLDTCTFLWLVLGAPELTVNAKTIFSDSDNNVYLYSVNLILTDSGSGVQK